jgi:hypothetical protein
MGLYLSLVTSWADYLRLRSSQFWMVQQKDTLPMLDLVPDAQVVVDQVVVMVEGVETVMVVEAAMVVRHMTVQFYHP